MPIYDFRCERGHIEERFSRPAVQTRACSCGAPSRRVLSSFAFRQYQVDRSNFALVAPRGADGKPMTLAEAQRSAAFDRYSPSEEAAARAAAARTDGEQAALRAAKKSAWREVSARWKLRVP